MLCSGQEFSEHSQILKKSNLCSERPGKSEFLEDFVVKIANSFILKR
jgi:hypothetical protein